MMSAICTIKKTSTHVAAILCLSAIFAAPSIVCAQEEQSQGAIVWSVAKSVLFDPTTYAPAVLSYKSQRMDWATSQVFFSQGWNEANPQFTRSGRPNDVPVSYAEGNQRIRMKALSYLSSSVINNIGATVVERTLAARFPEHRKLVRTMSWVERVAVASYLSYLASNEHFRQAKRNRVMAVEFGF
jgi:hypothetical protein